MSMKVLLLTQDFPPQAGGIAVFLEHICFELQRRGHCIQALAPWVEGCTETDAQQPYRVHRYVPPRRLSSIIPIHRALALQQNNRYDLCFVGHFMTTHALGALALCKLWDVPYLILSHGNDLSHSITTGVDQLVARLLVRNAALMLGNSHFTAERIRRTGYRGPVEVLTPGVDLSRFHPGMDTIQIRQQYGLDGHRVLLTTARLTAKKNVDGVLRALPRVSRYAPDVLYLIAGDGEERRPLEALCDELDIRHHVRFLGHVENDKLPALYCAADLFIMPSRQIESTGDIETFGISFIEANACGLPVIGGRSGGVLEAVVDGETGLLIDPSNVDEIAEAITRLLTDRALTRRLGENGRRRVEQELSWEQIGHRLETLLLERASGGRMP